MHPARIPSVLGLVLLVALAAGCSERASRITGNERLLRGEEGLGTTFRSDTLVDRDTYVTPATTQLRGATLLVGRSGSYEARALFLPSTWTLPESTATLVIDTVRFRLDYDPRVDENLPVSGTPFTLYEAGAAWDTTTVEWPGPTLGNPVGSGPDDVAPFTIELGPAAITKLRAWSRMASFSGFVLALDSGTGMRGFLAGTGRFEVVSHPSPTDSTFTTSTTRLPTDLSIHAPAAPASGSEAGLLLGGLFGSEALLRAPVAPPPVGFSINSAVLVARIVSSVPDSVQLQAFRVGAAWTEGTAIDTALALSSAALATLTVKRTTSGDSIAVPIPISVAREWASNPASNQGILIRVTNSIYDAAIVLGSRESAEPPILRLSTTSPPPGRF